MLIWAAQTPEARGAVNAVAPNPVTNANLARALGKVLGRPAFTPVPAFALRVLLGEFAQVALGSQRALPGVAERLGYVFRHTDAEAALRALLKPQNKA
jgi:NAD dependent epimerase/dehydratase family enzyme